MGGVVLKMRYSTGVMESIFGRSSKYSEWRRLWVILAEVQASMGLSIDESTIRALWDNVDRIDWDRVAVLESETQHDVVAHRLAFEECVPEAKGLLHWGATSSYITDNTDLILQRRGIDALLESLTAVLSVLEWFSHRWADRTVVGRTHLRPASPVLLGLRSTRWAVNFLEARSALDWSRSRLVARGLRGSVGTAATFVQRWGEAGAAELERRVVERLGFESTFPVVGQTAPRIVEVAVLGALEALSTACAVVAQDCRLMAAFGEFEEPFGATQVGSSAMPHKRNPILSERIVALNRRVRANRAAIGETVAQQGLERTLDDSALRRLVIPESFHLTDYSCGLVRRVVGEGRVLEAGIEAELERHAPAMTTEARLSGAPDGEREAEYWRLRSGVGRGDSPVVGTGRARSMIQDFWEAL